jgi:hypothetical protein
MAKAAKQLEATAIQVAGQDWSIQRRSFDRGDVSCYGVTETMDHTVTIYEQPHTDHPATGDRESTLIHELMHVALKSTGLTALLKDEVEEAIVSGLEQALRPHIQLRPELLKVFLAVQVKP